jgi:hypothetical protein
MSFELKSARGAAQTLDRALKPIADRPVDITDSDWVKKAHSRPSPLDEAGVREEAEALLDSLLDVYRSGGDDDRLAVREILGENPAFTWATRVTEPPTSAEGFRRHLLLVSAADGRPDLRDSIVEVNALCARAAGAEVDVVPVLDEVAAKSGDSIRAVLLNARQRFTGGARHSGE